MSNDRDLPVGVLGASGGDRRAGAGVPVVKSLTKALGGGGGGGHGGCLVAGSGELGGGGGTGPLLVPGHGAAVFSIGGSAPTVPLLTTAASAHISHSVRPITARYGGHSPPLIRGNAGMH